MHGRIVCAATAACAMYLESRNYRNRVVVAMSETIGTLCTRCPLRDDALQPSNILLNSDCQMKVCDFGLARSISALENPHSSGPAPVLTDYVATRWCALSLTNKQCNRRFCFRSGIEHLKFCSDLQSTQRVLIYGRSVAFWASSLLTSLCFRAPLQ